MYDVVAYDVCRIMMFVTYDVFEFVSVPILFMFFVILCHFARKLLKKYTRTYIVKANRFLQIPNLDFFASDVTHNSN